MRVFLPLLLMWTASMAFGDDGEMEAGGMMMRVEVPAGFLDLTQATVLASPGVPTALHSHLPRAPKLLTWPPPQGPLLVLGLPEQDEAAETVMDMFQLLDDAEDLVGGYAIWAWEAHDRPIVVILAADPAAMFAARFEFEAIAPPEMINPNMRTVNLQGSEGNSAVLVRTGQRGHQPPLRVRGWAPTVPLTMADAFACAGAHINQLWVSPERLAEPTSRRALRRARRLGIELVLFSKEQAPTAGVVARAKALGVRTVVVLTHPTPTKALFEQVRARAPDARILFAHRPETPRGLMPRAGHLYDVQTLDGDVPFLLDRWNVFDGEAAYVPSVPKDGPPGSILEGDRFELERLATLWDPTRPISKPHDLVARCFGVARGKPAPYLLRAVSALRAERPARRWLTALAKDLEDAASGGTVLVPVVPAARRIDEHATLDEVAWAFAARETLFEWEVLALSDGDVLYVALRAPKDAPNGSRLDLAIVANDRFTVAANVPLGAPSLHVVATASERTFVFRFDRNQLQGEAHAGRILTLHGETDGSASWLSFVVVP